MHWSEVIGQKEVRERLMQMVKEDRLPHALMLCGPSGIGKMALAMANLLRRRCSTNWNTPTFTSPSPQSNCPR